MFGSKRVSGLRNWAQDWWFIRDRDRKGKNSDSRSRALVSAENCNRCAKMY